MTYFEWACFCLLPATMQEKLPCPNVIGGSTGQQVAGTFQSDNSDWCVICWSHFACVYCPTGFHSFIVSGAQDQKKTSRYYYDICLHWQCLLGFPFDFFMERKISLLLLISNYGINPNWKGLKPWLRIVSVLIRAITAIGSLDQILPRGHDPRLVTCS